MSKDRLYRTAIDFSYLGRVCWIETFLFLFRRVSSDVYSVAVYMYILFVRITEFSLKRERELDVHYYCTLCLADGRAGVAY